VGGGTAARPAGGGPGQATCEILTSALGPLDPNLLGPVIELDQITLVITAESGPGNLLGAIAGLLDGSLDPGNLLDRILRILRRA
jgi:hypothetical protein